MAPLQLVTVVAPTPDLMDEESPNISSDVWVISSFAEGVGAKKGTWATLE